MPVNKQTGKEERCHLVNLSSGSEEYQEVIKEFNKTMMQTSPQMKSGQYAKLLNMTMMQASLQLQSGHYAKVHSIERIQNPLLYSQYITRKKKMDEDNPKNHVNERQLFHGTDDETSLKINQMGFDRNFAGKNGNQDWGRVCLHKIYTSIRVIMHTLTDYGKCI